MHITQLHLKNFRCFTDYTIEFNKPVVLIEGPNGAGKTSLLEALHYLCYLRSFRTYSPSELVQFEHENFFVKAGISLDDCTKSIQVGFSGKRRIVKLDQKMVQSYKELVDYYRVVTLTEDDLALVKEGPEIRRLFIDQALALHQPAYVATMRAYRTIVDNRNALLKKGRVCKESYSIWTQQLWQASVAIEKERSHLLSLLQDEVTKLVADYFKGDYVISFTYRPKKHLGDSYDAFMDRYPDLLEQETRFARSLFGAHLDDFSIDFQEKKSRLYASRGQQKLIVLLLKIAHLKTLSVATGSQAVFLLDDFMTDFDQTRAKLMIPALYELKNQLIFSSPGTNPTLTGMLDPLGAQSVKLTY